MNKYRINTVKFLACNPDFVCEIDNVKYYWELQFFLDIYDDMFLIAVYPDGTAWRTDCMSIDEISGQ